MAPRRFMYSVLIIDDEESVRIGLGMLINWQDYGFEVTNSADNGLSALQYLETQHYDVVITDIRMPEMDGLALIEKISTSFYPAQIIIISGYRDFEYAKKAIEYGVINYILKPINEDVLIDTLSRIKKKLDVHDTKAPDHELFLKASDSKAAMARIENFIRCNCCKKISLLSIAKEFNYSPAYLGRCFKVFASMSFRDYLISQRLNKSAELIARTKMRIYTVATEVGFEDINYFCKLFKKRFGMTPSAFRSASIK
jgi:two-component system, response regulator YesN